jgi:hypothetical protein
VKKLEAPLTTSPPVVVPIATPAAIPIPIPIPRVAMVTVPICNQTCASITRTLCTKQRQILSMRFSSWYIITSAALPPTPIPVPVAVPIPIAVTIPVTIAVALHGDARLLLPPLALVDLALHLVVHAACLERGGAFSINFGRMRENDRASLFRAQTDENGWLLPPEP